jgi:hypothetical protein
VNSLGYKVPDILPLHQYLICIFHPTKSTLEFSASTTIRIIWIMLFN